MTVIIPPGIHFIVQNLVRCALAPAAIYLANRVAQQVLDIHIAGWIVVLVGAFALPCVFVISVFWAAFQDDRNAKSMGAVMPPRVRSKWPAGVDLLNRLVKNKDTDYPSQVFEDWANQYGTVYNWRVLSKDRVRAPLFALIFDN